MGKKSARKTRVVTPPKQVEVEFVSYDATYYADENSVKIVGRFYMDDPQYGKLFGSMKFKTKMKQTPKPDAQESVGV